MRGLRHSRIVGGLLASLLGAVVVVLLTVEDISSLEERDLPVPHGSHRIAMLQLDVAQQHMNALRSSGGLSGAISELDGAEASGKARLSKLVHSSW
jgi:hypothetical protein